MRIAFNARLLSTPKIRGWNRYTINLITELSRLGVEIFLYSDLPLQEKHLDRLPAGQYQVRISPPNMPYVFWEQVWLPWRCKQDQIYAYHCPCNFGIPVWSPCARILTIHDAIARAEKLADGSESSFRLRGIRSELYHWTARTFSDRIIAVSQHAKWDLIKQLRVPESKISVIYEAADERFRQPISADSRKKVRDLFNLDEPYFLYVGGWEKRRNIPFLVKAFAKSTLRNVQLVIAGGLEEQKKDLRQLAEDLQISNQLKLLEQIEDVDLPALYAEALCFVYPSEYEGFGLQLCEAMATGCPVLASRNASLPEILGAGGGTFDPGEVNELATLMRKVATDTKEREELMARARERAADFSWHKTAESTLRLYEDAGRQFRQEHDRGV